MVATDPGESQFVLKLAPFEKAVFGSHEGPGSRDNRLKVTGGAGLELAVITIGPATPPAVTVVEA